MRSPLHRKPVDPGDVPVITLDRAVLRERPRKPRIRCPRCAWKPRASSRWWCECGHAWNTFDTGGRCPACSYQWTMTACLRCSKWSPHLEWYEKEPPPEE